MTKDNRTGFPFLEALLASPTPVVMEVKRRDAHGYDMLGGRTPAAIVAAYESAGAPCVSVVTGRWFGGSPALLRDVAALTALPILQKDFITRKDQIRTARSSAPPQCCSPRHCSRRRACGPWSPNAC